MKKLFYRIRRLFGKPKRLKVGFNQRMVLRSTLLSQQEHTSQPRQPQLLNRSLPD